jgi:hypothetical protein
MFVLGFTSHVPSKMKSVLQNEKAALLKLSVLGSISSFPTEYSVIHSTKPRLP